MYKVFYFQKPHSQYNAIQTCYNCHLNDSIQYRKLIKLPFQNKNDKHFSFIKAKLIWSVPGSEGGNMTRT